MDTSTRDRPRSPSPRFLRYALWPEQIEWAMIERLGKYQIAEQIGRGGMGAVYKASDPLLKRVVALKVISENVDESDELRARFFREAQACAQLSHPNIITIYDLGEDAGRLFIVMEYLEGEELKQLITERRDLPIESKLALMVQICDGLAYAHQKGIIHRDIKPSNVFILKNGVAKVLDFGVARIASAKEDLTHTGLLMGTLRYMSPEQARGRVDQRSDMFSVGTVFYELIAYHAPLSFDDPMAVLEELHSSASPSRFRPDPAIPEDLGAVIERALRKNPEERFRDMTEMREALDAVRARLAQEAVGLRRRLEGQSAEMRELHARMVELIGGDIAQDAADTPPVLGERAPVSALEALWRNGEDKLEWLRARVEQADRLRPAYQEALDGIRLGQWEAAVQAFERIVADMPEHAGAHRGLEQARTELLRAAEALQREREASEQAQQLMEEMRHRAAPAAAAEGVEGPWSSAESNRAAGLSALAEQSYRSARGHFEVAAEQYETAADAVDRRIQQLLRDARQRFEDCQFVQCLPLVKEVLTLVPEHPEALALSLEAERGVREEAERRAAIERRYNAAREDLAAGRFRGAIDALTGLVEKEPDDSLARQLLDDARAQLAAEEARARRLLEEARELSRAAALTPTIPEVPDEATVFALPAPAEPGSARTTPALIEARVPVEVIEPPQEEPSPPTAAPAAAREVAGRAGFGRLLGIRGRPLALAVGGLLVVAVAMIWVTTSLVPSRRLQDEVAQARTRAVAAREAALKVEANHLAAALFDEAAAKERDGEQLTKAGRLGAAIDMLRDATMRYEAAERAARASVEQRARADQARAEMLGAKERAAPETSQFKEGLTKEREGDTRYSQLAFQGAAESFQAAASLFASAPTQTPPPVLSTPTPAPRTLTPEATAATEIREMLILYSRVFAAKDLALLQRIRPGIRPEELARYRDVFDRTRSYKLSLKAAAIKVHGDEAEASGRREDVVVTSDGETFKTPGEFRFQFRRSNNRWTIEAVR